MLSKDFDFCVQAFLKIVVDLQDKSFHRDPIKHKKRIVYGLHEARKSITMKKSRILIIAPDLEKCPEPG
jgi:selenocysteine insertion sequence-binding protein 2